MIEQGKSVLRNFGIVTAVGVAAVGTGINLSTVLREGEPRVRTQEFKTYDVREIAGSAPPKPQYREFYETLTTSIIALKVAGSSPALYVGNSTQDLGLYPDLLEILDNGAAALRAAQMLPAVPKEERETFSNAHAALFITSAELKGRRYNGHLVVPQRVPIVLSALIAMQDRSAIGRHGE